MDNHHTIGLHYPFWRLSEALRGGAYLEQNSGFGGKPEFYSGKISCREMHAASIGFRKPLHPTGAMHQSCSVVRPVQHPQMLESVGNTDMETPHMVSFDHKLRRLKLVSYQERNLFRSRSHCLKFAQLYSYFFKSRFFYSNVQFSTSHKLTFLTWTNWRMSMSSSLFLTSGRTVWTTWQTTGTMMSLQERDNDSLYNSCWSRAIMWLWLAELQGKKILRKGLKFRNGDI